MNQCCCKESGWGRKHETMRKQKIQGQGQGQRQGQSTHALMQWSKSEAGSDAEIGSRQFKTLAHI